MIAASARTIAARPFSAALRQRAVLLLLCGPAACLASLSVVQGYADKLGLPALLALALVASGGFSLICADLALRPVAPRYLIIGPDGISIETVFGRHSYSWSRLPAACLTELAGRPVVMLGQKGLFMPSGLVIEDVWSVSLHSIQHEIEAIRGSAATDEDLVHMVPSVQDYLLAMVVIAIGLAIGLARASAG